MQSISNRLLISRFLTRSGDQAWDFAIPIVLLKILPGEIRIAALFYLIVRLIMVIILPRAASIIDRTNRFKAAKIGLFTQLLGVFICSVSVYAIFIEYNQGSPLLSIKSVLFFASLILGGVLSNAGSSFMDIAIANDLVPSLVNKENLSRFNSRLRQIDLLTELFAPILAGLVLIIEVQNVPLLGFAFIALWNIISFFPEFRILKGIFKERPDIALKAIEVGLSIRLSFLQKLKRGWGAFFKEPVALVVFSYSLLWLSVLSPHGVLLTAYLKDGWHLPEWGIGVFRGLGGLFGLLATILFPILKNKIGLVRTSKAFIYFQTTTLLIALLFFFHASILAKIGFLVLILFSRVGLYGFSLGEMQIRQIGVGEKVRGEINGFATATTGIATLGLYGAGTLLPSTSDFHFLVVGSIIMVAISSILFSIWSIKIGLRSDIFES